MQRCVVSLVLLIGTLPLLADEPHVVALNGHNFTLPTGFEIELAAGPPLVERPITIDFDERGRLYVAESSGSSEKVELQLEKKPHKILRLADTDGDGKFDKRTVFADRMMFPEGTLWHAGSLYVAAPPSIWKLTDTNDDGVADERVEWFQGKTLTGCANDLHGPYLGPDGWIYWCKGAFAKQTYQKADGKSWSTRASHLFRARPDGTGIEAVMTGGMDNPVDVAFLADGERIVSNTFLVNPGGGQRDGLIHAVYGGVYGKDHEPIYEHRWTDPQLMPVLSHLGPAAPCGLHCYQSAAFGEEYHNNLFTACFNMRKIVRTVLTPRGASYQSRDEDWLASDHVDFHPTDVIEDADGSLLVVDTGGWYKLCCPTSQIQKDDVLGGIYRVRKIDTKKHNDPRGHQIAWAKLSAVDLAKLLGDPRPAVQRQAIETLAALGEKALPALEGVWSSESPLARRNLIWTTCRIDHPNARRIAARGLEAAEPEVRQVAGHAASLWRDPAGIALQVRGAAANKRIAAEVAARSGDADSFAAILSMFAAPIEGEADRELDHSQLHALLEISERKPTVLDRLRIDEDSPRQWRAVITVLDQNKSPLLKVDHVLPALESSDHDLRETAFWIVARRPDWGDELVKGYREKLRDKPNGPLAAQLARLSASPAIQTLLAESLTDSLVSAELRVVALQAMQQSNLREVPEFWLDSLATVLPASAGEVRLQALLTSRAIVRENQHSPQLQSSLNDLSAQAKLPAKERLLALAAISKSLEMTDAHFVFLREQLGSAVSAEQRGLSAEVLSKAKLNADQLRSLADDLADVGPLEADSLLTAFARSTDDEVGLAVLAALASAPLKQSLPVGLLRERLKKFGPAVQKSADKLYAEMDQAAVGERARLEAIIATLPKGDIRRGQQVFHSAKAACSACHAIGYTGGTVGPDLTRIGLIRTERDLLESVLFPSSSYVQSYEPSVVVTKEGRSYSGLLRKVAPDQWQVLTGPNQIVRLAPDDIEEVTLGKASVMPAGLDQQLTPQQLADLVAFLRACR